MRKNSPLFYLYILFMGLLVVGLICMLIQAFAGTISPSQRLAQVRHACALPPEGFSEKDLIGTWVHPDSENSDTLIIREDGKYKQIIHIDYTTKPDVDYEGDWQSWRLEYVDNIPYVHLEGMRLCAVNPDLSCDEPSGKGAFFDFCRDEAIVAEDEGILIVLAIPKDAQSASDYRSPTRWINLSVPLGYEYGFGYALKDP